MKDKTTTTKPTKVVLKSMYPPDSIMYAYRRVDDLRREKKMSWDKLCRKAKISMKTWMTGIPTTAPTEEELRKIAPVLDTTFEYLRYGTPPVHPGK